MKLIILALDSRRAKGFTQHAFSMSFCWMFSAVVFHVMGNSKALGHFLAELYAINQAVCLRLPASDESLQQQINRIHQAQEQLEQLLYVVSRQARNRRSGAFKACSTNLLLLIQQTARQADNYRILAEEFPLDAHGSMDCLAGIQRRSQAIAQHIQALENSSLPSQLRSA